MRKDSNDSVARQPNHSTLVAAASALPREVGRLPGVPPGHRELNMLKTVAQFLEKCEEKWQVFDEDFDSELCEKSENLVDLENC